MTENVFINMKNRSHTITAEVEIPKGGANGVILCQAGRFGGWSLYVKDGKPTYTYNLLGLSEYNVAAAEAAAGRQCDDPLRIRLRRRRPGQGRQQARSSSTARKSPKAGSTARSRYAFSADEGADVGVDGGTPVTDDYRRGRQQVHRQDPQGHRRVEVNLPIAQRLSVRKNRVKIARSTKYASARSIEETPIGASRPSRQISATGKRIVNAPWPSVVVVARDDMRLEPFQMTSRRR